MRVILRETADAQEAVHGAGALIPVHVTEFSVAHGQVAVALWRVLIDQDVAGAVHWLQPVFRVVKLHGRVHIFAVEAFMPAGLPELPPHDVRGIDHSVPATNTLVTHPVFHRLADEAALWVPEYKARSGDLLD